MDVSLGSLLNLYQITTGRRLFAIKHMRKAAKARGYEGLAKHFSKATRHDNKTRKLELSWKEGKAKSAEEAEESGALRVLDQELDRTLSALRDVAEAQLSLASEEDQEAIRAMLQAVFPEGVNAVTSLSYVDQHSTTQALLERFPDHDAAIRAAGLERAIARLAALNLSFGEALDARQDKGTEVDYGTVRAARETGRRLLLQGVAMILGLHPSDEAEDIEARRELLGPLLEQNEVVASYYRRRRKVDDVDPKTGTVEAPEGG